MSLLSTGESILICLEMNTLVGQSGIGVRGGRILVAMTRDEAKAVLADDSVRWYNRTGLWGGAGWK